MEDGGPYRAWLLPRGEDYYRLGELKDGAVFDIEVDITLETVPGPGGVVLGFDVRWADDSFDRRDPAAVTPMHPIPGAGEATQCSAGT